MAGAILLRLLLIGRIPQMIILGKIIYNKVEYVGIQCETSVIIRGRGGGINSH